MKKSAGFTIYKTALLVIGLILLLSQPAFAQNEGNDFNDLDLLSSTIYGIDTTEAQTEIDQLTQENVDQQVLIDANNTENTGFQTTIAANNEAIALLDPATQQADIDALTEANTNLQSQIDANNMRIPVFNQRLKPTLVRSLVCKDSWII